MSKLRVIVMYDETSEEEYVVFTDEAEIHMSDEDFCPAGCEVTGKGKIDENSLPFGFPVEKTLQVVKIFP